MESTMVIKVKYGEMLRRFSVRILEKNQLDLDISGLKAKISSLFNFSPDTDLTLTYIDEDGDTVTLVNDDDLCDVMRQQLKCLRIDVHLRNENNDKPDDRPSGSATPLRSTERQQSFQGIGTRVAEGLKSLPDPIPESLQLLLNFASKSVPPNTLLAEIAQIVNLLGQAHLNPESKSSPVSEISTQNVASVIPTAPSCVDAKYDKGAGVHQEGGQKPKFKGLASTKDTGVHAPATPAPSASVDLNVLPTDYNASGSAIGKSAVVAPCGPIDGKMEEEVISKDKIFDLPHERHVGSVPTSVPAPIDDNLINECPFSGVSVASEPSVTWVRNINSGSGDNGQATWGSMFHKGVICDGCGSHPITGPRFKSKVKEDYDLCSICFAQIGNETDYIRMDHPISHWHRRMKACNRRHHLAGTRLIDVLRSQGKQNRLDSRFVLDVNVLDGTVMAPSTLFTKIWRFQNNGGMTWPRDTQLVWIGGDRFSDAVSVEIEAPADGLPVGKELDIAVDFVAPSMPGRYISYWRLASPSGHQFGQRVWVLIQVDASVMGPFSDSFQSLDLNLPPIGSGLKVPEDFDAKPSRATDGDGLFLPCNSRTSAEPVKPDDDLSKSEKELRFPINDALVVGQNPATPIDDASSAVCYPTIDSHGVPPSSPAPSVFYPIVESSKPIPVATPPLKQSSVPPLPSEKQSPIIDFSEPIPAATPPPKQSPAPLASSGKMAADNVFEETLLKDLYEMGFKHGDLNKEVLRMTEYNLDETLDELCGIAEWDPILEELEEMGFNDKLMNKQLLVKNNGSMKRVVMELISGNKKKAE